jgi:uncharacterized membrane protein
MLVAGLVLVILAALLVVLGLFGGTGQTVTFDLGVLGTWNLGPASLFLLGVVATLLLFVGLLAMRIGARRARAHRQDRKKVNELSRKLEQVKRDEHAEPAVAEPGSSTTSPTTPPTTGTTGDGRPTTSG